MLDGVQNNEQAPAMAREWRQAWAQCARGQKCREERDETVWDEEYKPDAAVK